MPSEERASVAGFDLRLQVAGSGPPLVYLHGPDGATWPTALDNLSERFRLYLPEHPGFGQSERPEWVDTIQDLALFYLDLFDALDLPPVNLVGHSLGGWIAAELASLCCHRLRGLVLVDAVGLKIPNEPRLDIFRLPLDGLVRAMYADSAAAERALAVALAPQEAPAHVRNRAMTARLGWNPYLSNPVLQSRLRRIHTPTLIVWGAQDLLVPVSHASLYAEAIPDARLAVIEACGHAPAAEQPEEFARVVGDFLAKEA